LTSAIAGGLLPTSQRSARLLINLNLDTPAFERAKHGSHKILSFVKVEIIDHGHELNPGQEVRHAAGFSPAGAWELLSQTNVGLASVPAGQE
jgi:hypothetical protein